MISEKMKELGSKRSTIRELFEYGKEAAKRVGAENVYDFSLGNPSTPPPEEVTETLVSILEKEPACAVHGYTSAQGAYETRKAIAEDMAKRYGAKISPDMIYMTCGAAASLTITMRALVSSPSDEIIAIAPYFPEYKVFAEGAGAKFKTVSPDMKDFQINFDALEAVLSENTAAIIVNSPNNPSGAVLSENCIKKLAEILAKKSEQFSRPIYIISDEPYREIVYGGKPTYIPSFYRNTIICYSYSKSLSLPGERIGYIALPDGVSDAKELYAAICGAGRSLGYVCAPALMQRLVEKCTEMTSDIESYRKNRGLLYSALTAFGYECVMPNGAFYLFIKAPDGDSLAFSEKAKKHNLLIVPGDDFGCPGYMRISYCVSYDMIKRSLPVFGALI